MIVTRSEFEELYNSHSRNLYKYVNKITHNNSNKRLIDDICQETWKRAWRSILQFSDDGSSSFYTWICSIARNELFSLHRRGYMLLGNDSEFPDYDISNSFNPIDFYNDTIYVESLDKIVLGLPRLDIKGWIMFKEMHLLDLTYDDLSKKHNCSVGSIKARLHRVRIRVRELVS